ncbi:MAG: hypothetical protein ACXW1D_00075 [Halobacteriota archaeon]
MKLRDAIALEAMKIVMSEFESDTWDATDEVENQSQTEFEEGIARGAYRMADAMLRVREEG